MPSKSLCKSREDMLRSEYEEPGPSFLRILVKEQILEEPLNREKDESIHSPMQIRKNSASRQVVESGEVQSKNDISLPEINENKGLSNGEKNLDKSVNEKMNENGFD